MQKQEKRYIIYNYSIIVEKCAMDLRNKGLEASYKIKCALRLSSALSALILAVLFSIAFFMHFEADTSLFKSGSRLIYVTETLALVISAVLALLTFILVPKSDGMPQVFPSEAEYKPYYKVEPMPLKLSRYLAAALVLAEGAVRTFLMLSGKLQIFISPFLTALMLVLTVPLALFFLPELVNKLTPGYEKTHLWCGVFGLFWFILNAINIYFDNTVALASPYRIFCQLAFLAVMLATVYEIKFRTDVPFTRARLSALLSAFPICAGFTFGRVIMLLSDKAVSADDTALIFTFVGFSVYLGARLFCYDED